MNLSAYGVESDDFPSIDAYIDFVHDSTSCKKWYYNSAHKTSTYTLSSAEVKNILRLLETSNLKSLQKEYRTSRTDQPTSTTTIYTEQEKFVVKDYGLIGGHPLSDLYSIVYKF